MKVLVFIAFLIAAALGYKFLGGSQAVARLAEYETALRAFDAEHPWQLLGLAFLLYVVVAGLSIPGAVILSLSYAWYFGFWTALPLVSFASTLGATLAFLLSRYLFRDLIRSRFGSRFEAVNKSLQEQGASYLFTLRLIPALPFFLVNILMGLTPIKTIKYWWVSQLGMLPGTIVFLWAGDSLAESVPTLHDLADQDISGIFTPRIWCAFAILAIFPYATKTAMKFIRHPIGS